MPVNYAPLWRTLLDKNIKRYDLLNIANVSANVVAKMARNEYVSLQSLDKICAALECRIEDVVTVDHSEEEPHG